MRGLSSTSSLSGSFGLKSKKAVQQSRRLSLGSRHQVPVQVEVTLTEEWPMKNESALALTPAVIMNEA